MRFISLLVHNVIKIIKVDVLIRVSLHRIQLKLLGDKDAHCFLTVEVPTSTHLAKIHSPPHSSSRLANQTTYYKV